ncbi:MAG: AbrB/MazE/SpoVT family DNA-binding domain-containing protein [Candidatus Shapirobacteria bacterium]
MNLTTDNNYQEKWVKILGKGMVTIPKAFRDELGFKEGEIARIQKVGSRLILEIRQTGSSLYSNQELKAMLEEDKLPPKLAKKAAKMWADLV